MKLAVIPEYGFQELHILFQVCAKIVRMPPEVKQFSGFRRMLHSFFDATEPQWFQQPEFSAPGAEKTGSRHIHQRTLFHIRFIMAMMSGKIEIGIRDPESTAKKTFIIFIPARI